MEAWNCWAATTFTEIAAGEIVMLILVEGSVQVEVEVVVEEVELELVQLMAVLVVEPQEARPERESSTANNRRRFTAPLSSLFEVPETCDCVSTLILKI
jgi:hypothetical protein